MIKLLILLVFFVGPLAIAGWLLWQMGSTKGH